MTTLTFTGEALQKVAEGARSSGQPIHLAKDQGIYLCVWVKKGEKPLICYAKGYDPATEDPMSLHLNSKNAVGGDDFGEEVKLPNDALDIAVKPGASVKIRVSPSSFSVDVLGPKPSSEVIRERQASTFAKHGYSVVRWISDKSVVVRDGKGTTWLFKLTDKRWKSFGKLAA